jgi:sugar phosphate isomerase/epimerase
MSDHLKESKEMNTISRRSFMKTTAAAAALAGAGISKLAAKPLKMPIGLQLYSVRELLPTDFDGTLAKLRAAGYTEVEAAGYYKRTPAEFRKAMDKAGLRCISTHHSLADLRAQGDELIDYGHKLGVSYIVCPWPMPRDPAGTFPLKLDDWRWVAEELNKIGEKVKAAGMSFGYHNHDMEFTPEGGVVIFDELLRLTDPKLVCFEMDCGLVAMAGRNPVDYLSKMPERFPLMHVKAVVKGADGKFHDTNLGRGVPDYQPVLRAATALKHYFIEQEDFDMDPIEALRLDVEYMRKLDV